MGSLQCGQSFSPKVGRDIALRNICSRKCARAFVCEVVSRNVVDGCRLELHGDEGFVGYLGGC